MDISDKLNGAGGAGHGAAAAAGATSGSSESRRTPRRSSRREVRTFAQTDHFLSVRVEFADAASVEAVDDKRLKAVLLSAIRGMYGAIGSVGLALDVLTFDPRTHVGIIRTEASTLSLVWGALALFGQYDGKRCRVRVLRSSGSLMGLACDEDYQSW